MPSSPTTCRPLSERSDVPISAPGVRVCRRTRLAWGPVVVENRSHERRRLRQADTGHLPSRPSSTRRTTRWCERASWSWTTRTATGSRWASSSWRQPVAARSRSCRWHPNGETGGLRNALAIGAAKAVLVSDPLLAGSDALGTAKVLAAVIRRLEAGPGARRHRVDRRLHGHHAGPGRRAAGLAVCQLRQSTSRSPTACSRSGARPRPATTRSPARSRLS